MSAAAQEPEVLTHVSTSRVPAPPCCLRCHSTLLRTRHRWGIGPKFIRCDACGTDQPKPQEPR